MIDRPNPLGVQNTGQLPPGQYSELIKELIHTIKGVDRANTPWIRKQERLEKLRFGPREKRNFPWPNASNYNVPLTDGIMRRFRPALISLILDATPIATFQANNPEEYSDRADAELVFDWLMRDRIPEFAKELSRLVELYGARGHAYSEQEWRYSTELMPRIVLTSKLFPEGLEVFLQQAQAAQLATGEQAREPIDLIAERIEAEYNVKVDDPQEGPSVARAAAEILGGAESVRIHSVQVKRDEPFLRAIDPVNVIVDQDEPDIEDAEFFAIIHHMSADRIRRLVADGVFTQAALKVAEDVTRGDMDTTPGGDHTADGARSRMRERTNRRAGKNPAGKRSGISRTPIWRIYAKMDINGNGVAERVVLWYAPKHDVVLSFYEFPLPLLRWPVTLYQFEEHAPRPFDSRGIPELVYDLHRIANAQHNMRLDAGQLLLNPPMKRRPTGPNTSAKEWRPGGQMLAATPGDLEPMVTDLRSLDALLREEQVTQRSAETYIGTFDATINNLTNQSERRTAAEVNAVTQLASNVFGLDARNFQQALARAFNNLWSLWLDLGPAKVYARVRGKEEPKLVTMAEIGRGFDVRPAGTPASTNRAFMLGALERVLPALLNDQSGVVDRAALIREWIQLLDPKLGEKVIRNEEQTAQAQLVLQAAQIAAAQGGQDPGGIVPA